MSVAVCPMCHRRNRPTVRCCDCGYEFGQSIETLHGMLRDQLANARATFWVLGTLNVLAAGIAGYLATLGFAFVPFLPVVLLTRQTIREARKIAISRRSLALIQRQRPQLPKATLVSG